MPCDMTCVKNPGGSGGSTCIPHEVTTCYTCWEFGPPYYIPMPSGKEGPYSGIYCDENGNAVEYIGYYPCDACTSGYST